MGNEYVLVTYPHSQKLMKKSWFNECILGQDIDGHDEVGSSAYFVPKGRYNEIFEELINL